MKPAYMDSIHIENRKDVLLRLSGNLNYLGVSDTDDEDGLNQCLKDAQEGIRGAIEILERWQRK